MKDNRKYDFKEKILNENPKIDRELIKKAESLEKQLIEIGVSTKPQYTLSHPLSSSTNFFFNR